jgi:hypothetical protein
MTWLDMIPSELYGEPQKKPSGTAIGFTGFGSDGKLQPSNPTNMVQTTQGPRLLHEGEATMQGPDGNIQVIPQDKLRSIGRGMKGFETGGTFTPADTNTTGLSTTQTGTSGLGTPAKTPETDVQQGIGVLKSVASGQSPVTESLYNQATSSLGGAQTAAIGAAKQEAAQAGYSKEGIGSVAQTTMRNMEGERSKLFGSIASSTQSQMVGAANNLITAGQNERSYTDTQNQKNWQDALLYNDPSTPEGKAVLADQWTKTHPGQAVPDFNVMSEERKYAQTQREQSTTQGSLSIESSQISNMANRLGVDVAKMTAFVNAVNSGADLSAANATAGTNFTQGQYDGIARDYSYTGKVQGQNLQASQLANDVAQYGYDTNKLSTFIKAVNSGVDLAAANATSGTKFTQEQYDKMARDYAYAGTVQGQETAKGILAIESGQIANMASELGISASKMKLFIDTVNNGGDLAAANAASGLSVTQAQYNGFQRNYAYEGAVQGQALSSNQIANDAAKLNLSSNAMKAFVNAVNSGGDLAAANQAAGTNLTQNQYNGIARDYAYAGAIQGQAVQNGVLAIESNKIANMASELGISAQKMKMFVDAVNSGADLATANSTSGMVPPITASQFNGFQRDYAYAGIIQSQAAALGAFNVDNARIQNDANKFQVEPNKVLALVAAINNGSVTTADEASNFLGKPVSTTQFDSMRSDKTYTEATRDINLLSAKTQLEILKGTVDTTKYENLKQRIKDGATLDEIQKTDPTFSAAVYTALNRELTIDQGLRQISLDAAKASLGTAAWSSLVNKIKDSNGAYTLAQIQSMPEFAGMTITQQMLDGINSERTEGKAKTAFDDALLYNDPSTAAGKTAIQKAWLAANPGKTIADAPDFNQLAEAAVAKRGDTAYTNTMRALNLSDAQFSSLASRIKATNGKMTLAEAQAIVPNITQIQLDGLNSGAMQEQNKAIYDEMKLNFNPNDPDAKTKLEAAWKAANPSATSTPDFTVLAEEALTAQQERKDTAVIAAGKLSEALIGDVIDTNSESISSTNILTSKTYQSAINNQNLRQSIATMNGWKATDPRINGIIQAKIETAIKGDVPLLVQKFVDNGYVPETYKDTPGWEGQLKRSIQDMLNSGALDKDGNLTGTGAYPWDDPSTFNNYTDWNGKDIVYDASGNKPVDYAATKLNLSGNGTTYYQNVSKIVMTPDGQGHNYTRTTEKKPITFADMDNTWQTLTESEKAAFFSDENGNPTPFNQKSFMDKYFLNGTASGGIGVSGGVMLSPTSIDNYLMDETNGSLSKISENIMGDVENGSTGFTSGALYPGKPGVESDPNAGASLSTLNAYQYYDEKGVLHSDGSTANGGDTQLNKVWLQFSQMFNGGNIMTAQEFKLKWNEGKGWYVNSDGIVTNFLPEFKTTFGSNGPVTTTVYYDKKGTPAQPIAAITPKSVEPVRNQGSLDNLIATNAMRTR